MQAFGTEFTLRPSRKIANCVLLCDVGVASTGSVCWLRELIISPQIRTQSNNENSSARLRNSVILGVKD